MIDYLLKHSNEKGEGKHFMTDLLFKRIYSIVHVCTHIVPNKYASILAVFTWMHGRQ
jgi:hypothetical protein